MSKNQLSTIADIHYASQHDERGNLSADQVALAQVFDIALKHLEYIHEIPTFEAVMNSLIEQMNS